MQVSTYKKLISFISILGFILTAFFAYKDSLSIAGTYHYFALWSYSPFVALLGGVFIFKKGIFPNALFGIAVAIFCISLYAHIQNQLHPDAQGALIYLFLPVVQWIVIVIVLLTAFILNRLFLKK